MKYPEKGLTKVVWGPYVATVHSIDGKAWHIVAEEDGKVIWHGVKYVSAEEVPALIEEKISALCRPYQRALIDGREHRLAPFFVFERPAN